MAGQQMGGWAKGYDWYLTSNYATFFGVQGEVFYLLFLCFPIPSIYTLKVFSVFLVFAVFSKIFFGYDIVRMIRRIRRFWLGRKRPIYDARNNFLNFKIGD